MEVIVSVTTTKARLNLFFYSFQSLRKQTYSQFKIFVFLSKESYLFDDGIDIVPDWITGKNVQIVFVKNSGPYRKLLPIINSTADDDIIITVDDDVLYPDDWVQNVVRLAIQQPSRIVCGRARVIKRNFFGKFQNYTNWSVCDEVDVGLNLLPIGCAGVVYRKYLLDLYFLSDEAHVKYAPTSDDIWFKVASLRKNTEIYVDPKLEAGNIYLTHNFGLEKINIYSIDNKKKNLSKRCIDKLITHIYNYFGVRLSKNDFAWKSTLSYSILKCQL